MAIDAESLKKLIESGLPGAEVRIEDLAGDGEHYAAHVTSPLFKGLLRVKQHQLVYEALGDLMKQQLHALAIHTYVPTQGEK